MGGRGKGIWALNILLGEWSALAESRTPVLIHTLMGKLLLGFIGATHRVFGKALQFLNLYNI